MDVGGGNFRVTARRRRGRHRAAVARISRRAAIYQVNAADPASGCCLSAGRRAGGRADSVHAIRRAGIPARRGGDRRDLGHGGSGAADRRRRWRTGSDGGLGFTGYKHTVTISYLSHGATYVAFSLAQKYWLALLLICGSRVGMAVCSVLNYSQLLKHTPDEFRGRVFSTMESLRWGTMIGSMAVAGVCSQYYSPRGIGVVAGMLGRLTAICWAWADRAGWLREPGKASAPPS